ncbi:MAG: hypothetical protein A2Y12_03750 [Planctomycetes bacterium GWF2_42_9]|nr:MAG: hypothetical protein A2Y12_03750 [Planctomycetes bacterium GWF2_42_9]
MDSATLLGALVVVLAGLLMGSGAWPIKLMKSYRYEHFAFISMLVGLIIGPWLVTLIFCPNAIQAYKTVDPQILIKSNLFSMSWGIANILCMLCFVRIGFCLTGGILTGIGVTLGVTIPMAFKGTGLFSGAPDLTSKAGLTVLGGACVMVVGVIVASLAGFGRDKALQKTQKTSGSFTVGFIMVIVAGILSCGVSFSFVYSQGPIVAAIKAQGAGDIPANFAVWAVGLCAGGLICVLYPAWLMTKNKSWGILGSSKEMSLSILMGVTCIISVALMGNGMLMLGAFGASVGFGIQQAMQMIGGQAVGFIGGEWKNVYGTPRNQMYLTIALLIVAAIIMAFGNSVG